MRSSLRAIAITSALVGWSGVIGCGAGSVDSDIQEGTATRAVAPGLSSPATRPGDGPSTQGGSTQVAAPAADPTPSMPPKGEGGTIFGSWRLLEIGGDPPTDSDGSPVAVQLQFVEVGDRGSVQAELGCNAASGPFEAKSPRGGSIRIGPLAATEMWCEGRMALEGRVMGALSSASHFEIEAGRLTLQRDGSSMVLERDLGLRFSPAGGAAGTG